MNKKDLLKRAKDTKYIVGIYNYCDRWCERCQFTAKCLNYSLLEERNCNLDEQDMTNAEFWQKIQDSLQMAINLLKDIAEEEGIDLDSIEIEIENDEDDKNIINILFYMSKTYIDMIDDWFNSNLNILENEIQKQNNNSHLKLINSQTIESSVSLEDIIEVLRWYQYQIHVKIARALTSKETEDSLSLDDFPKDSDGSAKIALIGIDRSISVLGELLNYFQMQREKILNIINYLKRLRDLTEIEFPDALAFIRVGFDE